MKTIAANAALASAFRPNADQFNDGLPVSRSKSRDNARSIKIAEPIEPMKKIATNSIPPSGVKYTRTTAMPAIDSHGVSDFVPEFTVGPPIPGRPYPQPGVSVNLLIVEGTGAGRSAQAIPDLTFSPEAST